MIVKCGRPCIFREKYQKRLLFKTRNFRDGLVSLRSMTVISLTKLYDLLTSKLGKETAENLTTFIAENIKEEVENKTQILATKEDLANTKVDLIKWIFAFWVALALMIIGLYLKK
jgi:ribosomal protein L7/L12